MQTIQYRVIPVTRYFVTRFESDSEIKTAGSSSKGEYENEDVAHEVAYALCKAEHDALGWPIGDERIRYPDADRKAKLVAEDLLSA